MFASIAVLAEAAGEAAHEASKAGLPQLNPDTFVHQLFWLVVTFLVLLFVMSRIALPRVGEVIEERAERIQRVGRRLRGPAGSDYRRPQALHRIDAEEPAHVGGEAVRVGVIADPFRTILDGRIAGADGLDLGRAPGQVG